MVRAGSAVFGVLSAGGVLVGLAGSLAAGLGSAGSVVWALRARVSLRRIRPVSFPIALSSSSTSPPRSASWRSSSTSSRPAALMAAAGSSVAAVDMRTPPFGWLGGG